MKRVLCEAAENGVTGADIPLALFEHDAPSEPDLMELTNLCSANNVYRPEVISLILLHLPKGEIFVRGMVRALVVFCWHYRDEVYNMFAENNIIVGRRIFIIMEACYNADQHFQRGEEIVKTVFAKSCFECYPDSHKFYDTSVLAYAHVWVFSHNCVHLHNDKAQLMIRLTYLVSNDIGQLES